MASKALVVGSGAIGLRTALELLRQNIKVHLRSPRPPLHPSTCSVGSGGLWMPFHCDDDRTDKWALETLDELLHIAATGEGDVEIVPTVLLKTNHSGPQVEDFIKYDYSQHKPLIGTPTVKFPSWTSAPALSFQHLTVEMLLWQNTVNKLRLPSDEEFLRAGYKHAWFFRPPIVDPPRMLSSMLSEIENHPLTESVNVDTGKEYKSMQDMVDNAASLGCDAIVNCTGMGSSLLCNDETLVGARGILHQYDRTNVQWKDDIGKQNAKDVAILTEEAPWGSETEPCYMIPRGNTLVVGGTYLEGDKELAIRDNEESSLLENAGKLGIDTDKSKPIGKWTGFRPYRPTVRLEIDSHYGVDEGIKCVHNYGHGGSGWTVYVGAAKHVGSLLTQNPN